MNNENENQIHESALMNFGDEQEESKQVYENNSDDDFISGLLSKMVSSNQIIMWTDVWYLVIEKSQGIPTLSILELPKIIHWGWQP